MFQVGQYVYWKALVGKNVVERAGKVVAIVPSEAAPIDHTPAGLFCKVHGAPRRGETYLVEVPGIQYVFWPIVSRMELLPDSKLYVLESQPKSGSHYILKTVDRSDRKKLRELAKLFGDAVTETKDLLEVRAWRTRFWFDVAKGVEFIASMDRW